MTILAFAGSSALDQVVLRSLRVTFTVHAVSDVESMHRAAVHADVLILGSGAAPVLAETLQRWPKADFGRLATVVDQRLLDPERAIEFAVVLERMGVSLIDAPIHCELAQDFPALAATLCGGSDKALDSARPVLEAMGAPLIHFGGVGSGHMARALVGAAASCNRMVTYECAATGLSNGLSIADMALVLNRSSGNNSASAQVLPHIGSGVPTTDQPIGVATEELRIASLLAMRAGAPLLLGGVVSGLCQGLTNGLPKDAGFDEALASLEAASGLQFAPLPAA